MTTKRYAMDVRLFASIRVEAESLEAARKLVRNTIQSSTANLGFWPNGDPIVCEVSVDDDVMPCYEVDDDNNHPECDC